MDKKTFVEFTKKFLETKLHSTKLKPREVEICLYGVIECLIRVVELGDEVRLPPFGVFFPRAVIKQGTSKLASVRVGFNSFSDTNKRVFHKVSKLAVFREPGIRLEALGKKKEVQDSTPEKEKEFYNLSEIARMANISYPTARKYIAKCGSSLPSIETGTGKRYPPSVVSTLAGMRQRPVKPREPNGLYTLSEVSKKTGITTVTICSYLTRYNLHPTLIEGKKVFYDEAFVERVSAIRRANQARWGS